MHGPMAALLAPLLLGVDYAALSKKNAARGHTAPEYVAEPGALECPPVDFRWVHQEGLLDVRVEG